MQLFSVTTLSTDFSRIFGKVIVDLSWWTGASARVQPGQTVALDRRHQGVPRSLPTDKTSWLRSFRADDGLQPSTSIETITLCDNYGHLRRHWRPTNLERRHLYRVSGRRHSQKTTGSTKHIDRFFSRWILAIMILDCRNWRNTIVNYSPNQHRLWFLPRDCSLARLQSAALVIVLCLAECLSRSCIVSKRLKVGLWNANKKPYPSFRMVPFSMTSSDP